MGDVKETIAKNILFYRKKMKLSQKELAKKIGVNNSAISNWENGINSIDIETLFKVCKTLNISIDTVFGVNKESELTSREENHIEKYRDTDDPGKEVVDYILNIEYDRTVARRKDRERGTWKTKLYKLTLGDEKRPKKKNADPAELIGTDYYIASASAGTGTFLDEEKKSTALIPAAKMVPGANFTIAVSGNSMEPVLFDNDLLLIKKQDAIEHGELGVFIVNGEGFVKRFYNKDGVCKLVSLNIDYPDIAVHEHDNVICAGKVLGKVDNGEWHESITAE